MKVDMVKVVSSNIDSVGYDEKVKELYVRFKGGLGVYKYLLVPKELVETFMLAESKGKFFNSLIKNRFVWEKVVSLPSVEDLNAIPAKGS